jgi:two-component system cell cycle sensor histidine kinase/response regulator CckA
MKPLLRILHIEDSLEDSELVRRLLAQEGIECELIRAEDRSTVFDALQTELDLILADLKLPNFSGMQALEISRALKPEVPFIFVSGTLGEEAAIQSLRNGATDFVLKHQINRLPSAVQRAIAESEERRLRHQLQQRLREVARLEAVSTLSNGIAHDFNNILTIILGHASLLTMEYDRPERVLEITGTITAAARRASEVVQQLLAFAQKSDRHPVPTDINRRIQESLSLIKSNLSLGIEVVFEPTLQLPEIMADIGQLDRMFQNLVNNAAEAMPGGGRVRLITKLVPGSEVPNLPPGSAPETYICLSVSDEGMGMDSATREHIFEPFFTTKERGRGTGLGLPVVYGLIQAHHGTIHVDSDPGQGTTVSLFFPVTNQIVRDNRPVSHLSDPALSGNETLLVVEDEVDVGFFLETILRSHGYRVLLAHDYEQAVQLFEAHQESIQLVFSDVGLPKTDGITLCSELKARNSGLKLIISSGYAPKEFRDRLKQLGPDTFLAKPYTTNGVLRCVREILNGTPALAHG